MNISSEVLGIENLELENEKKTGFCVPKSS